MTVPRSELVEIVTTVSTEAQARELAGALVRQRLVACASFHPTHSIYPWEGRVEDEPEFQLVLKTVVERAAAVEEWLGEHHPYDVPAVLRVPVLAANAPYGRWVRENVDPEREDRP